MKVSNNNGQNDDHHSSDIAEQHPHSITPTKILRNVQVATMSNYEQLHRQCRTLENIFDTKLTSYSQLVSTISRPTEDLEATGSSERWKDLEIELDELLEKA